MSNNFTCNTRCSRGHLYNKKQTKFRKTITTIVQSSANLKLKMLPVIAVLNTTYNDTCLTAVSREQEFSIIMLIIHAFCLNVYNVLQVLKVACRKYYKLQFKLMFKSLFFFFIQSDWRCCQVLNHFSLSNRPAFQECQILVWMTRKTLWTPF